VSVSDGELKSLIQTAESRTINHPNKLDMNAIGAAGTMQFISKPVIIASTFPAIITFDDCHLLHSGGNLPWTNPTV